MTDGHVIPVSKAIGLAAACADTDDVNLVWFCYILGGWKAMVSTIRPDDLRYFEVTYNAASAETYVDEYIKLSNVVVRDDDISITDEEVSE